MKPLLVLIVSQIPVLAQLVISPNNVTITAPSQSIQFHCLTCSSSAKWAINGAGLIDSTGKYTAPPIFPVPPAGQNWTVVTIQVRDGVSTATASVTLPKPSGVPGPPTCIICPKGDKGDPGASVKGDKGDPGTPGGGNGSFDTSMVLMRVSAPIGPGSCGPGSPINTQGNVYAIDSTDYLFLCREKVTASGVVWVWKRFPQPAVENWIP